MQPNKTLAAIAAISLGAAAAHAATVYTNGTTYSGFYLNPGLSEVGDEIVLGPGDRIGSSFRFEYYGLGPFSGNEQFEIRFYNNDGPLYPNSMFYDSGPQGLALPSDPSGRSTYQFDLTLDSAAPITLPDTFTWT